MMPEMHCKLALNAQRLRLDFNIYIQEVLKKAALKDIKVPFEPEDNGTIDKVRDLVPPDYSIGV